MGDDARQGKDAHGKIGGPRSLRKCPKLYQFALSDLAKIELNPLFSNNHPERLALFGFFRDSLRIDPKRDLMS